MKKFVKYFFTVYCLFFPGLAQVPKEDQGCWLPDGEGAQSAGPVFGGPGGQVGPLRSAGGLQL